MKQPRIDVLDTGRRIQNWMIEMQLHGIKFNIDVISRVTGEEQNNVQAIIFVGIGRARIKFNNEVLFLLKGLSTN